MDLGAIDNWPACVDEPTAKGLLAFEAMSSERMQSFVGPGPYEIKVVRPSTPAVPVPSVAKGLPTPSLPPARPAMPPDGTCLPFPAPGAAGRFYFATGKYDMFQTTDVVSMDHLATSLRDSLRYGSQVSTLQFTGHTDSPGTAHCNVRRSLQRALGIARTVVSQLRRKAEQYGDYQFHAKVRIVGCGDVQTRKPDHDDLLRRVDVVFRDPEASLPADAARQ